MKETYKTRLIGSLNENPSRGLGIPIEEAVRKRSDTSQRLLIAAIEMFADRGFEATSMRDLASEVGIKAPAIYNHYRSKEDILAAALIWVMEDFSEHVLGPDKPNDTPVNRLKGILERHLLYQINNPVLNRAYDVLARSGVLVRMERQDAQNEVVRLTRNYIGVVSDLMGNIIKENGGDIPPLKPAVYSITTMYDQAYRWYHRDGPITESELIDTYWQFTSKILEISETAN